MNRAILIGQSNLLQKMLMRTPLLFIIEGPSKIPFFDGDLKIRREESDDTLKHSPPLLTDGNRMIGEVVVDDVEEARQLINAAVIRVHAIGATLIERKRSNLTGHVIDQSVPEPGSCLAIRNHRNYFQ